MEKRIRSALSDGKGKGLFNNVLSFSDSWDPNKINNSVLLIFFEGKKAIYSFALDTDGKT